MLRITIYNLSVKLETNDSILIDHINNFINKYYTITQKGFGYNAKEEKKEFLSKVNNRGIFYFHVYQFLHFKKFLEYINYPLNVEEKIDKREYNVSLESMKVRDNWIPRDYQEPIINFLLENTRRSKLIPLQTGSGKTFISLYAIAKLSQRIGIVILPTYIDKWVTDIVNIHEARVEDILVVQGQKSMRSLIELAKNNEIDNKYIIFSSRTYQEFITLYEQNYDEFLEIYGIEPIDLFPLLEIGVLLIDETHQHFHAIFKILLHINVKYQIGLSATLISDNYTMRKLHSIVYPKDCIYNDHEIEKYTDLYAISYSISPSLMKFIRTENRGSKAYSHIAFEQSILKRDFLLNKYLQLIERTIEDYFLDEYMKGDKLLIFVSTVELATILANYLQNKFPAFNTKRYCEDDPYEHIEEADIIVSTIISAGTGIDIKNLRVVIQTISISSSVANIQSFGRLRKLKDRDTKFCYLYCNNIEKHRRYHVKRLELFENRAKRIIQRHSRVDIC